MQKSTRKRPLRSSLLMALLLLAAVLQSPGARAQFCNRNALVNMGDITASISTIRQSLPVPIGIRAYWTFDAVAGVTYTFGSCASGEDTYLRIYSGTDTATATEVASNDDFGPLCSSFSASIGWTCATTGTYSILLTRRLCSTLQRANTFTYQRSGAACSGVPTVGSISVANSSPSCGTALKTLTLTGYSRDAGNISVQWQSATPSGGFTDIPGATLPTYITPSITTTTRYRVAVTCNNSSVTATTSNVTVTVNPNPSVSLSPAVTTICGGVSTTTLLSASGANTYVWTAGGTGAGSSRSYSPTATTIYEVTGISTATGCSTTKRATIIVGHTIAPAASPATICAGGSTQLSANISGAPAAPGYRLHPIAYAPIATPGSGVTTLAANKIATVATSGGNLGDGYWTGIVVPFSFKYYGLSIDSIEISTNGHVNMPGAINAGGFSGSNPVSTYPNGDYDGRAFPLGSDINLTHGGTVEYFTTGTTPARKFVINYKDVVFDNNEAGVGNVQMIINESNSAIEFHTGITTNVGSPKTQGLISLDGNTAILVPGRNGANEWTGYPDAVSFVPVTPLTFAWTPAATLSNAAIASPTASGIGSPTTYNVTVTDAGINCSATGSTGVTLKANGTWTGAVSRNWGSAGNWCGGVPTASSDVLIPDAATVPLSPHVSTPGSAGNIILQNGAVLTLDYGPLELYGNITATGTGSLQANGGTLNLTGSGVQTLTIPSFTVSTLNIDNGETVLTNDVNVTNALNFTNGIVDIGSHTLALDAGATISGSSATGYVRTSAPGGRLRQEVGATPVLFPVGNTTYNPATLTNSGNGDNFSVGVRNQVLTGGTTGTQVNPATTYVVNRTWDVEEATPGGSNITMTLGWNSGETNSPGFDYSNVYIAHHTGGKYNGDPDYPNVFAAPTATGYPGPGPYTATRQGITSFSPFTVGSASPVPLPVTLLQLTAKNTGTRTRISWESASERHMASYIVERSADGVTFNRMEEVAPKGKASAYTAYNNAPANGYTYYRLKMVDADGTFAYSAIVKAFMSGYDDAAITAIPNPVTDLLTVRVRDAATGDVQLTDAAGRVLIAGTVHQGTATMATGGLAAGTYFLRFSNGIVHKTIRVTKL